MKTKTVKAEKKASPVEKFLKVAGTKQVVGTKEICDALGITQTAFNQSKVQGQAIKKMMADLPKPHTMVGNSRVWLTDDIHTWLTQHETFSYDIRLSLNGDGPKEIYVDNTTTGAAQYVQAVETGDFLELIGGTDEDPDRCTVYQLAAKNGYKLLLVGVRGAQAEK